MAQRTTLTILALLAATLTLLTTSACSAPAATEAPQTVQIKLKGKTFTLETALDVPTRTLGLGNRESIPENGGMIFVFPYPKVQSFWMAKCLVDIDIAYVDDNGSVLTTYTMLKEPPKAENETQYDYESRLKGYSSRFPCRIVLEFKAGTLDALGVQPGDQVTLDLESLKPWVQ